MQHLAKHLRLDSMYTFMIHFRWKLVQEIVPIRPKDSVSKGSVKFITKTIMNSTLSLLHYKLMRIGFEFGVKCDCYTIELKGCI